MVKMRDNGIEWIGEIPEDWSVTKLKYEFDFGKGLPITKDNLIEIGLPVVSYGQIHSKLNNGTSINPVLLRYVKPYYQFTNPQSRVKKGDFIFADTSEDLEGCGNAVLKCDDSDLFAGYHSIIMHSHKPEYAKYFSYLFLTDEWRNQLRSRVYGVKVLSVTQTIFKFTSIILPPPETQKRIADFLDEKCAKIDGLKNDIQKQIETLEQYKKSVITEAVTKGINPNAKMKESGIEWIGEIPDHWEIKPLGHILNERIEKNYPVKTDVILSLSIDIGITLYSEKTTNLDRYKDDITGYKLAHEGDLVLNSMNVISGAEGISTYFGCVSPVYYVLYDNDYENHYIARFYDYYFKTLTLRKYLFSIGKGILAIDRGDGRVNTCRLKVSNYDLKHLHFPMPQKNEIDTIVNYLDKKCSSIESIISTKKQQLEKLEEYKKSLIFEYVTGKKEIV